eukprot:NODE_50_length_31184_cov_0.705099.p28 type:complete len:125 gc:universal NODE_50_length_31184_cov_0.705099:6177-5803(-)
MTFSFSQYSSLIDLIKGMSYINDEISITFYGESNANSKKRLKRLVSQYTVKDGCLMTRDYKILLPRQSYLNVIMNRYFLFGQVPLTKSWKDFASYYETKKSRYGLSRKEFEDIYFQFCCGGQSV